MTTINIFESFHRNYVYSFAERVSLFLILKPCLIDSYTVNKTHDCEFSNTSKSTNITTAFEANIE